MRYFPFRLLILCIVLPFLLYLISVKWLEYAFSVAYDKQIKNIHSKYFASLFEGSVSIEDTLNKSIERFNENRFISDKQLKVIVTVLTKQGDLIYPSEADLKRPGTYVHQDQFAVAERNYRILNDGFDLRVSVLIPTNSFLSYLIFFVFISLAIGILFVLYKKSADKIKYESETTEIKLNELLNREEDYKEKLDVLSVERKDLELRLKETKGKLAEIRLNEDGLVDELVKLEKMIEENVERQALQEEEIKTLKTMLEKNSGAKKARLKQKIKQNDTWEKRFRTLYKNLVFNDRFFEGFLDFEDDLKLKCEEIIYLLNSEPDKVIIKRKVFGKKNRETVFEVVFSYNGRVYFRKLKDGPTEVLAAGTKNTQDRDLEFLDKL